MKSIWKPFVTSMLALAAMTSQAAGLTWAKDMDSALRQAKAGRKFVMVDFTAVWCVNCHKLEKTTYRDAGVLKLLSGTVPVQIDFDKQPALAKRYRVTALPVILFLDSGGKEVGRISKYVDAQEFMKTATPWLGKAKK